MQTEPVDADSHLVEIMINANHLHPVAQVFSVPSSVSVLEGPSVLEHLNRIVTIETLGMPILGRKDGLICNANGRILDLATVCNLDGQAIILGNQGTGKDTRQNLASGIPWNEDLKVKDADDAISHLVLIGQDPFSCLINLGIEPTDLSTNNWSELGNSLLSIHPMCPNTIQILTPSSHLNSMIDALKSSGAQHSDIDEWRSVRMLSGIMDHHELNPDNLPFELGLSELVALDKGCYPGQEIHARMESRGVLARCLVRLKSDDLIPVGKSKIENVGRVSVTDSNQYDEGWVALALIPYAAEGIEVIRFENEVVAKVELI